MKKPSEKQLKWIHDICKITGLEFNGKTSHEASMFIEHNKSSTKHKKGRRMTDDQRVQINIIESVLREQGMTYDWSDTSYETAADFIFDGNEALDDHFNEDAAYGLGQY